MTLYTAVRNDWSDQNDLNLNYYSTFYAPAVLYDPDIIVCLQYMEVAILARKRRKSKKKSKKKSISLDWIFGLTNTQ